MNASASQMSLVGPDSQDLTNEISVLQQMLKFDGAKVLELGCGAAEKTRMIVEQTGVETVIASEVDEIQHQKNLALTDLSKVTFKTYGAEAIAEPDQCFDIVLMFKSLHHVPLDKLDNALQEIHRVLKPGGFAYISEPVFAGRFNDIMQIYHNEQEVRQAAFDAVTRSVANELFHLESEYFFQNRIQLKSWLQYEEGILNVTHTDHNLSEEQHAEVKQRFLASETDAGFIFDIPNRVDLLRKTIAS